MSVIAFPTAAPFGTQADQPMRVLRHDLSSRVARVNDVRAMLKRCGVEIASQDLINDGGRPLLVLKASCNGLRGSAQCIRLTGDTITAVIEGVDVRWPHSARV